MFINAFLSIYRHIALRQDHYECALLFLMRGVRLDIKNNNGLTPAECMPQQQQQQQDGGEDTIECKNIVRLSSLLHEAMQEGGKKAGTAAARGERVVSNDVSRGKEPAPIQVVNAVDDAGEPGGYVYVAKNCVTNSVPLDANISKLQVILCIMLIFIGQSKHLTLIMNDSTASAPTPARRRTPATAPT